jgi:hypothetical protein
MNAYRIEVLDTATWCWRTWRTVTFPTRAAALAYWHDGAPGRNDQCRVVQVAA